MKKEKSKDRKQRRFILFLIIILLLLCTLIGIFIWSGNWKEKHKIVLENGVEIDLNKQPMAGSEEGVEIPGLHSRYVLSSHNKGIPLINPENNTVYFKYTLYARGYEIYKTDWVTPNRMVEVNLWDMLSEGEHDITVHIDTLDILSEVRMTTVDLATTVMVIKNCD